MKAVQATQFGDPSVLREVTDLPDPTPGPGQISIDVAHAAVGLIDLLLRQGQFRDQPGLPQPPFVPGLEVAGTVRELGEGVTGLRIGEPVVSMSSGAGAGGYASIFIAEADRVASTETYGIDPALAVSAVPNAAMAHVALTKIAHLVEGESVLVHGALGGFPSAFPGIAKRLGAARVVGTVRPSKLAAAERTKLPYDRIAVDTPDEQFDVIIDAVGGDVRTRSPQNLRVGGRLIVAGNASQDWTHEFASNDFWLRNITLAGFNAGTFLRERPQLIRPAMTAALEAVAAGLSDLAVEVLPFSQAVEAHERMESRDLDGRIVLTP